MLDHRRPPRLHLMVDDRSAGVWDHKGNPLDPAKLSLSAKLRTRPTRWCARFERSCDPGINLHALTAEMGAIARAVKVQPPGWSIKFLDEGEVARAKYQGTPASCGTEIP